MRSLIARRRADPAPSRLRYRLARLWLRRWVRLGVTAVLPLTLAAAIAGAWIAEPANRDAMRAEIAGLTDAVRARPEFMLTSLAVIGGSDPLRAQISEVVGVEFPVSSLALDLDRLRARVAALSAVAEARVSLADGGLLVVKLRERRPAAVLRRGGEVFLIGAEGHEIARLAARGVRPDLPLLAGEGAQQAVPEALALMRAARPVAGRIRGLVRVGARRWDLVLDRGQRVMLPGEGAEDALRRVMALDAAEALLERDVTHVDLRDPARPVLRLGVEALRARPRPLAPGEET